MKANQYFIFDSDSLKFNMNMSGVNFARSRLQQYLKASGFIAKKNPDNSWSFTKYFFEETVQSDDKFYICGKPFNGIPFFEILTSSDYQFKKNNLNRLIDATEFALAENIQLPVCGPVCTLINTTADEILFLPMELTERSLIASGKFEYNNYYGKWVNKGLDFVDAHRFLLSNYVYFLITSKNAFNEIDEEIRTEDYYDCNYIPLELTDECINSDSGKIITFNLSKGSPKGRKSKQSIIIPNLESFEEKIQNFSDNNEKELLRNKYLQKKQKKISIVRKYRKNIMPVKTAAYIVSMLIILILVYFMGKSPAPDTLGLHSREVAECTFTGINKLDIQLFMECMKGNTGKNFQEIIAGFYTSGKMRANYEREAGTLPPASWFYVFNKPGYSYWTFGITNLTLNNTEADCYTTCYKPEKQKRKRLTEENGKVLQKGDVCLYQAHYFLLHHETLDKLYVDEHTSNLEITYNGKKFLVTSFEDSFESIDFSTYDFNKELTELISKDYSIQKCCEILKEKYPWIPAQNELLKGKEEIRKFFLDKYMIKYPE